MNNKIYKAIVTILSLAILYSCEKEDNNTDIGPVPPIGVWKPYSSVNGTVYDLAAYGNVLYAATDSGLFRSKDNAKTWANIFSSISGKSICKVSDALLIIGTKTGLYKSTNGGNTWILFNNLPAKEVNFVTKDYDGNLWVGLDVIGGTYFSNNLGNTWTNRVSGQINGERPFSIDALPSKTVFLGGAGGAYFIKNTDTAWTQIPIESGMDFPYTATIKYMQDSVLLACVWHTDVLGYSSNLGRTWQSATLNNSQFLGLVRCTKFLNLDSVYLASDLLQGIYASRNGGSDWTTLNDSLPADDKGFWSLVQTGDYVIAGSSKGTIYRYRYR